MISHYFDDLRKQQCSLNKPLLFAVGIIKTRHSMTELKGSTVESGGDDGFRLDLIKKIWL